MDPNERLRRIRAAIAKMDEANVYLMAGTDVDGKWFDEHNEASESLREHVAALDEWLSDKRGFTPTAWHRPCAVCFPPFKIPGLD